MDKDVPVTHRTSPNLTNFPLPSLYLGLSREHVDLIEQAFAPCNAPDASASDAAFQQLPDKLQSPPAVVIGRGLLLLAQWRFKDAYFFLQAAVAPSETQRWNPWAAKIANMFFAYASIVFKGSFVQARECMKDSKRFFRNARFEDLDALKIYCLREYLRLVKEAKDHAPNFDLAFYLDILRPYQGGLHGIAELRIYLLSAGRLREAVSLHDMEEDFYTDSEIQVGILQSLTERLDHIKTSVTTKIAVATKYLGLVSLYDEMYRPEEAKAALEKAAYLVRQPGGQSSSFYELVLRFSRIRLLAPEFAKTDTNALIELADRAAERQYFRLECAAIRFLAGVRWIWADSNQEESVRHLLKTRLEHRATTMGNTQLLAEVGLGFYAPYIKSDTDTFLSWWNNFDKISPNYGSWQQKKKRSMQLITLYTNLGKAREAHACKAAAEQIIEDCALFWGLNRGKPSPGNISRAGANFAQSEIELRLKKEKRFAMQKWFFEDHANKDIMVEDPRSGFFYMGTIGSDMFGRKASMRALFAWMLHDLNVDELLPSDFCTLFGFPITPSTTSAQCKAYLETLDPQEMVIELHRDADGPVSCELWAAKLAIFEAWLLRTTSFPEVQQRFMLLDIQWVRCEQRLSPEQKIVESRRGLDLLASPSFEGDVREGLDAFRHRFWNTNIHAYARIWRRASDWSESMEEEFQGITAILQVALDAQKTAHATLPRMLPAFVDQFDRGMLHHWLGYLHVRKRESGGRISITRTLFHFRIAEMNFRSVRTSERSHFSFQAIKKHLASLENPLVNGVFPMGIRVQMLSRLDNPAPTIWAWIQAAKCRGISSLGRGCNLDEQYSDAFLSGQDDPQGGFGVGQLQSIERVAGTRVVFVDWYTNTYDGDLGMPLMMIYRSGGQPKILNLDASMDVINLNRYKERFAAAMKRTETHERNPDLLPEYWLQKFDDLVKPLLLESEPGDTLVFSPCGVLRGLPLHAVLVEGQPLIRRNPVVYTDSMRSLFYSAASRQTDTRVMKDQYLPFRCKVFGDPPAEPDNPQLTSGQTSVEAIARTLEAKAYKGPDFRRGAFIDALKDDTSFIHYHAHFKQHEDPFAQTLIFADAPLPVRDILDLRPGTRSFHATVLGCGSGATVKSSSNEPLGLVPALMYAGAASVVSALWPIHDPDAALFADEFYVPFRPQPPPPWQPGAAPSAALRTRTIDLARATQRAVLGILDRGGDRVGLRHWAGFVLTGWWMLEVPAAGWEALPVAYSARPWPPPPPPSRIGLPKWLYMVPRWFSFHTLWPYFR